MRLIISGGGTGGHIYPALAIIEDLMKQEPNSEVLYVGSHRGLESTIVPKQGIKFTALRIQGFRRSLSLENFKTLALFFKSVHESKKIVKQFKPDVVIGTGGYVSGAVVYAAAKAHIPTIIHEQNSAVGLTNKFLSHYVDKIAIGFHEAKDQFPAEKVIFAGNPRAQQVAHMHSDFQWSSIGLKDDQPTVLIFGGSQGAPAINNAVIAAISEFNRRQYQVVFVTGQKRYAGVMAQLEKTNVNDNIKILPYIDNMPQVLPKVSLIVGRSGATSIAEITALGIPSVLIPSPYVTADHQTKNTMSLVTRGAALMIKEPALNAKSLLKAVDQLMHDPAEREKMSENSKDLGVTNSADQILDIARSLIHKSANRNSK
ncbi:undecaprenyldiphospho-muramoylpentapeptide beta-N-acetylglucosaminyltransferase [Lentilactobacillus parafarraginis]|jgi:UDP-N-acetylglucosamine--N-acetylmuramyl-(pentapeptide) pyrophosphoryl-undecaprenol N-acetylglucosamine transferase|uniref:UDP-N-acetylglucosamine--N-acetylmuramyl-(pentapeptide) pyrophosphoryl-undecaprenol N-acetylglucosamine transferase n=2 Tax=Lentilactobacillus parafarraginis TaxID=390842 RepID=A0A0R1YQU5_9LACO|nr:undecaprenyldiphospho-muramoylpentapeptide beta-N-acetylglucosaminyltransferase [Lentilactobacillus parafarraginis]KRM44277.1 undecaprenyldiphospho-muramoylpentapeptide beta-N-acetylglucosaminyltransferase [Lentilactobacillus parafarraginis DSM 18390 = JCM 14109]TLQ19996.1 undecaprenyldiphospho-muramoylpentapeptide beta-N-acetylglucosaminyltransferase [Lentilactobacillus parafarraginis]